MAPKKLHVTYTNEMENLPLRIMTKILPKSVLMKIMMKMSAPKSRPLDVYEALQEEPSEIIEIEKDRVWLVTHVRGGEDPKGFKSMGLSPVQENYDKIMEAAKLVGEEAVKQAEKDWSTLKDYLVIDPKEGVKGEYCKAFRQDSIMVVVKLPSEELMLFNPVPIHEGTKLDEWMKTMGKVKVIVIGSSFHTLFMPETFKRYPDVIYIGTKMSEEKLKAANALPKEKLYYDFLEESDVKAANESIGSSDIVLKFVKGDMLTHSIFLQAYETGVEVDLLYGHHEESTCDFCLSKGIFEKHGTDPAYFLERLFTLRLLKKPNSPFGYLPGYRFAGMDPTSPMSKLMTCPRPAEDGSSCKEMANSLREILKMDYKNVISIHWGLQSPKDFRLSMNEDWKWLDGESLLQK